MKKSVLGFLAIGLLFGNYSCSKETFDTSIKEISSLKSQLFASTGVSTSTNEIPLYGNAFFSFIPSGAYEVLTSYNGLANWTNSQTITSLNVNVPYQGTLKLKLNLKVAPEGQSSVIRVTVDGVSKELSISGGSFHEVDAGEFIISSAKTVKIDFQGVSKTGGYYADLLKVGVSGTAINGHGNTYSVPLAGNAFITAGSSAMITSSGLANWTNASTVASTYVRANGTGNLSLKLNAKVAPSGNSSVVKVTVNGVSKNVNLSGGNYTDYYVGDFPVTAGYNKIDLQGVSKTGGYFADVASISVGSDAVASGSLYSNDVNYYYWARRGPSCHLGYTIPTSSNVSYYYSEIVVPTGEDKIGSYYMANGFSQGYFGIQVNSATERRVLFSVWSPYSTDNPNEIPDDQKIKLNRKGTNVYTGEFGNEGSGGQSYLVYNWQAGNTYKFLLKGDPDGTGKTDFTAWFFAPELGTWQLIASFKRPNTNTYLTGFYSFLENFSADNGHLGRTATYKNQWVRTSAGVWNKVTSAKFTVDATYSANQRIDAIGGTNADGYFLRNGGFFSDIVAPNTNFSFSNTAAAPTINFTTLP